MKYALTLLIAACLLLPASLARAADEKPAASPDEIKKLIDQLGDGEYARREEAARKLKAIGKPALPALKEAITAADDAEIVSRAQALVKRIEIRPVPQGDPGGGNGLIRATRIRMSANNGNRTMDVSEGGRDIKITEGADGITMSVTGLVDGERATEEYTAKDAEQLREENPEAYELYQRWAGGRGMLRLGGPMQLNGQLQLGGAFVQPLPVVPDELDLLRARLDKQMKEARLKDDQRAEVSKGIDQLVDARNNAGRAIGMEKYTEQCDELRKTLEQYKLDPGDLLPPPAKTRLGVSVQPEEGRLFVQRVSVKSRAERIGLRQGDQIRKVDGKEIATVAELRRVVGAREKGLVVEVTRDGDDLKLEEKEEAPAK